MSFKSFVASVRPRATSAGVRLSMSKLNDAISLACYDRPYSAACAAENDGKLPSLELPPPFVGAVAERFGVSAQALGDAIVAGHASTEATRKPKRSRTVDLGWTGVSSVPLGSLVIVAATRPPRRDAFLAHTVASSDGDASMALHCTSENVIDARHRIEQAAKALFSSLSRAKAEEEIPSIPRVRDPDVFYLDLDADPATKPKTATDRAALRVAFNAYKKDVATRAKAVDDLREAKTNRRFADWAKRLPEWFTLLPSPRLNLEQVVIGDRVLVLIDDLTSLALEPGKRPTPQTAGEVARELKSLALEHDIVIVAGLVVAERLVKDRDTRREVEAPIRLQDLSPYGNPHETADVVLEAMGDEYLSIFNRYPEPTDENQISPARSRSA